jgi:hypothetical protein
MSRRRFLWLDTTEPSSTDDQTAKTIDGVAQGEVRLEQRGKGCVHLRDDGFACVFPLEGPFGVLSGPTRTVERPDSESNAPKFQDCGIIPGPKKEDGKMKKILIFKMIFVGLVVLFLFTSTDFILAACKCPPGWVCCGDRC